MPGDVARQIVPRLTLRWREAAPLRFEVSAQIFADGGIAIGVQGHAPRPVIVERGARQVALFGSPILGERIDPKAIAEKLLASTELTRELVASINGQFLIVFADDDAKRLTVINDRYNGVPLYYAKVGDEFVASFLYFDLFRHLKQRPGFRIDPKPMLEAIRLQRVLGYKTFDNRSRFLPPASVLDVTSRECSERRYWRPDFQKASLRKYEAGEEFTRLLRQAVRRLSSDPDPKRYGLFLSGGHDSRTVLSAFERPPVCFTVSFTDNLEVACARRAAEAVGAPHRFLKIEQDHLIKHQQTLAALCGGMFATDNALFVGLESEIAPHADLVFHGHAFDYLFHGMYLPSRWMKFFGRPTFFRKMTPIQTEVAQYYLDNIPFRISDMEVLDLLRPEQRDAMREYMLEEIRAIVKEGQDCAPDVDSAWEYLIIHALGRHYSHPNITSKMCSSPQRTIAFENELFALYAKLPPEYRLHANVMRHAMWKSNPKLAWIPTGNYGVPAGATPATKTAMLVGRKILRDYAGMKHLHPPHAEDRTWPERDTYIRQNPAYLAMAKKAVTSPRMHELLPYFDWPRVQAQFDSWMNKPSGGGKFLVSLLSLHGFLEQVDA